MTYSLSLHGYCGQRLPILGREDLQTCRDRMAKLIRGRRMNGDPVLLVGRGNPLPEYALCVEFAVPENAVMVSDLDGVLSIYADPALESCLWCGQDFQPEDLERCCSPCCSAAYSGRECDCESCASLS